MCLTDKERISEVDDRSEINHNVTQRNKKVK